MQLRRALAGLVALGCAAPAPPRLPSGGGASVTTRGYHVGPSVYADGNGPARFVGPLLAGWQAAAAQADLERIDGHYREPGNEGYELALDLVLERLRAAGFGADAGLELEVLAGEPEPTWTPRGARLALQIGAAEPEVLLAFDAPGDRSRTMLPVHAPAAEIARARFACELERLEPGWVLVTPRPLGEVLDTAEERGACAVLSSYLQDLNVDPRGSDEHRDAIHYGSVRRGTTLPVLHVSPRIGERLAELEGAGRNATLSLRAEVEVGRRPVRTLVATISGCERPDEVVAVVAHVQEPGANDNASGTAGVLEGALTLRRAIAAGELPRPRRSLAFVWGVEYGASRAFLEHTERRPIAGLSADMLGAAKERTGAICLLERAPDPGALEPLPPDRHTPWGAGEVAAEDLLPNGLAVIVRCALVDVGIAVGGWETSEHPWEGGSDHDVFLERGIPGVLLWHFTDFTYHTSLDRLERVDPEELRRAGVALVAGAAAVADARPVDLRRYVESALRERYERQGAVVQEAAGDELGQRWAEWGSGARRWLAALCNGQAPAR